MSEPLERLFLRGKPVSALLAVGEMQPTYAAQVAKRIDSTFPHTCNILSELEAQGLLTARPEGRINYLELTDRGKKVAQALSQLLGELHSPDGSRRKLMRLEQIVRDVRRRMDEPGGRDSGIALQRASRQIGPLRRDLARLMSLGDGPLIRDAKEVDESIAAILSS